MDSQGFLDAFEHIANAPGGIAQLRSMIYQLAVTGALTPRLEGGLSALELLRQVNETRQSLIKAKRYKRMLELEAEPVMPPQGIQIPQNWEWSRLLDLGEINPRNAADDDDLVAFLPMRGVPAEHRGTVEIEQGKWSDLKKGYTHFAVGDVVLAKITPCFENGKAAVIPSFQDGLTIGGGTTELLVFRPIDSAINTAYVYLFLRSPMFGVDGEARMTGTAGQKRLPTEYFATRAFPLPPVDEQAQIVAKVDELMSLCDRLEEQQKACKVLETKTRKSLILALASASQSDEVSAGWSKLANHFFGLFSSWEDVEDLRRLICGLAVRGLVAEHVVSGQTSHELVERLREQKNQLLMDGILSRAKPVVPESFEEDSLPSHWVTITLDEAISGIDAGWSPACLPTPRKGDDAWGVLKTTSVQKMSFNPLEHKELPASLEPRAQYELRDGDILVTRAGPKNRVGICCVATNVPPRLMISDKLIRFHIVGDLISSDFVAMCITHGETGSILERLKSGMADSQMNISQDKLRSLPIPVPPYLEQLDILKRIERLMAICDHLQDQMKQEAVVADRLATSCVSSISGISVTDEEAELKAPQTELIAPLRIGAPPSGIAQAPLASILVRHSGSLSAKDLWQRFGGEIGSFYAQLKHEVAQGWIVEPEVAEMRERESA